MYLSSHQLPLVKTAFAMMKNVIGYIDHTRCLVLILHSFLVKSSALKPIWHKMTDLERSNLSGSFKVLISLKYLQEIGWAEKENKTMLFFWWEPVPRSKNSLKGNFTIFHIECNKKSNFYRHIQGFRLSFVIPTDVKTSHDSKAP